METIETLDPSPFKHLVMTIGNLPSSFVDSMSYYECIAWLVAYIRDNVIPACNNNAEAIQEIQQWIETLDLQDEVDHKLEEMAASGELGEILAEYVQPLLNELDQKIDANYTILDNKIDNDYTNLNDKLRDIITGGIAPIPVASTDDMTDTSRIYVNTTDGEWYYWDGTAWTSGGTYQASEDSDTVMITNNATKGLGQTFTAKGLMPLKSLYTGYLNSETGAVVADNSRMYTSEYVPDSIQRVIPDSGYAVACYFYNKADNSYVGRMLQNYTLSNSASPSPAMKWFTDVDINFLRGKYPNYGIKLVMRKDDYSSIQNIATWLAHFTVYVKNETEQTIFNQNTEYQFNIDSIWNVGEIDGANGTVLSTPSRLYTNDYIPSYVSKVHGINSRVFKVHAYLTSDDSYVGRLVETGRFAKSGGTTATPSEVNFDELKKNYPLYSFKLTAFVSGSTSNTTILQGRNVIFVTNRKNQNTITSRKHYGYEVKALANTANHDMTVVGDFIYLFDAPSASYTGKFNILNADTLNIAATKYTNFHYTLRDGETESYLRMKSVDYNPANNVLMVANGQVPVLTGDSYIFMYYQADEWRTSANAVIDFSNCGAYKQIDVSALGDRVYAFWKCYESTDEIYVTNNNLNAVYLIELGKGTNNFGMGEYEAADSDKYNGSYRIVECWKQINANVPAINAHGGQVWKGDLYLASNNEFECVVYKTVLGDDGTLKFEKLDLNEYANKTLKYSYIDGMLIKDGILIADPLKVNEVYNTGTNKVLIKVQL